MGKITILPSGETFDIGSDESVLECLKRQEIYIRSSCGGHASCSDCVVKVKGGEEFLNTPSFEELRLLGNVYHITKERLSCQLKVKEGEVEIDISSHDLSRDQSKSLQKNKQFLKTKVRKKSDAVVEEKKPRVQDDSWVKHWEKTQEGPKKLGGGKRPRPFRDPEDD